MGDKIMQGMMLVGIVSVTLFGVVFVIQPEPPPKRGTTRRADVASKLEYDDCTSQGEVMRWARSNGIGKRMSMHLATVWQSKQAVTVEGTTTLSGEYEPVRERATRLGVQTIRFD